MLAERSQVRNPVAAGHRAALRDPPATAGSQPALPGVRQAKEQRPVDRRGAHPPAPGVLAAVCSVPATVSERGQITGDLLQ
jgi:hypothetical protein